MTHRCERLGRPCCFGKAKRVSIALGLSRYFTGKSRVKGHVTWRRTSDGKCIECVRHNKTRRRRNRGAKPQSRYDRSRFLALNAKREPRDAIRAKRGTREQYQPRDIIKLFLAQNGKCAYCKIKLREDYEVDHIVAVSRGGRNSIANLQLSCPSCNRLKGAKHPVDFAQSIGLLV